MFMRVRRFFCGFIILSTQDDQSYIAISLFWSVGLTILVLGSNLLCFWFPDVSVFICSAKLIASHNVFYLYGAVTFDVKLNSFTYHGF